MNFDAALHVFLHICIKLLKDVSYMNKKFFFPLELALNSLSSGFIIIDRKGTIQFINPKGAKLLKVKAETIENKSILDLLTKGDSSLFLNQEHSTSEIFIGKQKLVLNHSPIFTDQGFYGISAFFEEEHHYEGLLKDVNSHSNLNFDLQALLDTSYDVIYVSDNKGVTLRVSSACKELWGKDENELVGTSVYSLEREGIYTPSITRLVLEKKAPVSEFQITRTGRKLKVIGTPIKDKSGEIVKVVNVSKDITEISQLQSELQEMKKLAEAYRNELEELRVRNEAENQLIFRSIEMNQIVSIAKRVANVDSTVLIFGETGVGKEVIANYIHKLSPRSHKPFIKLNCGAIPENLLESELFGYEKGAFTGAVTQKIGMFELANGGTIFLDEIGEMPLSLQTKLLRVIQEREMLRVGGTKPIKFDVRILTATNRNLVKMVDEGTFREDLYYRLNVIPVKIPPLRERHEDILALAIHFINYFNQTYSQSKKLSSAAFELLQRYNWPGNVRELQNIIERLVVLSDDDTIEKSLVEQYLYTDQRKSKKNVNINNIMPLKDCVEEAERQLLELAQRECSSTAHMAVALGVNQSTISRKLQKINLHNK